MNIEGYALAACLPVQAVQPAEHRVFLIDEGVDGAFIGCHVKIGTDIIKLLGEP